MYRKSSVKELYSYNYVHLLRYHLKSFDSQNALHYKCDLDKFPSIKVEFSFLTQHLDTQIRFEPVVNTLPHYVTRLPLFNVFFVI